MLSLSFTNEHEILGGGFVMLMTNDSPVRLNHGRSFFGKSQKSPPPSIQSTNNGRVRWDLTFLTSEAFRTQKPTDTVFKLGIIVTKHFSHRVMYSSTVMKPRTISPIRGGFRIPFFFSPSVFFLPHHHCVKCISRFGLQE